MGIGAAVDRDLVLVPAAEDQRRGEDAGARSIVFGARDPGLRPVDATSGCSFGALIVAGGGRHGVGLCPLVADPAPHARRDARPGRRGVAADHFGVQRTGRGRKRAARRRCSARSARWWSAGSARSASRCSGRGCFPSSGLPRPSTRPNILDQSTPNPARSSPAMKANTDPRDDRQHAAHPRPAAVPGARGLDQVGAVEPRRLDQGPHRAGDGRGGGGRRRASSPAARSSSRPAATPASAWRWSPRSRATSWSWSCPKACRSSAAG